MPVAVSTKGYCKDIFFRQSRQRPFKIKKLKIGMLSYQLICFLQFGHLERDVKKDCSV